MKKIIISIIAVSLLTLVSFSNVVGYNTVKTSQEELIESKYSFDECKEYLFDTLVEISENPEIKDIINSNYKPKRTMLPFRRSNVELKLEHIELLYEMGLKIMDRLGEERVEELMENIEIEQPEYLDELDAIVMGNYELRERIYTLKKMNSLDWEDTPIICGILGLILAICFIFLLPFEIIGKICFEFQLPVIIYYSLLIISSPILLIAFPTLFLFLFTCFDFYPY